MKRKWDEILAVALVFGLAALTVVSVTDLRYFIVGWPNHPLTTNTVEAMIASELPPQASKSQVLAWSKKRLCGCVDCIEFDPIKKDSTDGFAGRAIVASTIDPQLVQSVAFGNIPDAGRQILSSEDIHVYFFFDKDELLLGYHVKRFTISW
jgi:hypothetical protein